MTTATLHQFTIDQTVTSTAIQRIQLIPAADGTAAYDAVVTFQGGREYVYNVDNDATAERWYSLLSDAESNAATSWGNEVNHAINHGDMELAD